MPVLLKRVSVIGAVVAAGYLLSLQVISGSGNVLVILLLAAFALIMLVRYPVQAFIFGFICIMDFFGLYTLHISGVLKLFDFGFILCWLSGFFILVKKLNVPFAFYRVAPFFRSSLTSIAFVYGLFLVFVIIATVLTTEQGIKPTIQIARSYFFYMLYFPFVLFLLYYDRWDRPLKWLIIIGTLGAFMQIFTQVTDINLFRFWGGFHSGGSHDIGGYKVYRWRSGMNVPTMLLISGMFSYILFKLRNIKKWPLLSFAFLAAQPAFSFTRGFMISTYFMLVVIVLVAPLSSRFKIRAILQGSAVALSLVFALSVIKFGSPMVFLQLFYERAQSARVALAEESDTYEIRSSIFDQRLALAVENPVWGAGFIHPESDLYPELENSIRTGHHGYASLFGETGFVGFALFVLFTVVILRHALRVLRSDMEERYRIIALATIGYILQGYPHMLSTNGFVSMEGFMYLGFLMAFLHVAQVRHCCRTAARAEVQ